MICLRGYENNILDGLRLLETKFSLFSVFLPSSFLPWGNEQQGLYLLQVERERKGLYKEKKDKRNWEQFKNITAHIHAHTEHKSREKGNRSYTRTYSLTVK